MSTHAIPICQAVRLRNLAKLLFKHHSAATLDPIAHHEWKVANLWLSAIKAKTAAIVVGRVDSVPTCECTVNSKEQT